MKADKYNDSVSFSDGTTAYAFSGVVGLSPDGEVKTGYDSELYDPEFPFGDHETDEGYKEQLTKAQCIELADFMIQRWAEWRATIEAKE